MKNNIRKFYAYNLLHSLVFAYVIERLFWASRGMDILDVVWIEIIYSGVVVLLELPTGMLADRFSRKTWIVLDACLAITEFVIIIYASRFWHFAIAITLSAIGHAFQSGAHNALLYDSLKASSPTFDFEKILGRIKAFDYSGALIAGLIGALVATNYPLVTTYWLSLISLIGALFIALSLKDYPQEDLEDKPWTLKDWLTITQFIFTKKSVRYMAIVGMVTGALTTYIDEFWQLYLQAVRVDVLYFGLFEVMAFGAVALGSLAAYKFKDRFGMVTTIEAMMATAMISFIGLATIRQWYLLLSIGVIYYAMSVIEPLIYAYLHDHAIPKYRATIESAYSLLGMMATMIIGLPFGMIANSYNIFIGFGYLAGLLVLLNVTYWLVRKVILV